MHQKKREHSQVGVCLIVVTTQAIAPVPLDVSLRSENRSGKYIQLMENSNEGTEKFYPGGSTSRTLLVGFFERRSFRQ
jgi:hypothetical protein